MNAGLVLLSFRRALHPAIWIPALLLLAFAAGREHDASLDRAFARQEIWLVPCLFVLPLLVWRAAGIVSRWREADADWRAPRGASRGLHLASTWLGTWLAGALLLVASAVVAGLRVGAEASDLRWLRAVSHPAVSLLTGEPVRLPLDVTLDELAGLATLRFHPSVAPGKGPAARIAIDVVSGAGPDEVVRGSAIQTVHGRTSVSVDFAEATGNAPLPLVAVIRRLDGTGLVVFPSDRAELLVGDGFAHDSMLPRTLAFLSAAVALALGLGAWMRPGLAAGCVLCAWLVPFGWRVGQGLLPGGDLFRALDHLGGGVAPPPVPGVTWIAALLLVGTGLGLARRGLHSWRSPA